MIDSLLEVRGVRYASLVDAQGQVILHVGQGTADVEVVNTARAMLGSLKSAMGASTWNDLLLDLDRGPMLLTPVNVRDQIMLVAFDEVASLGRVRFAVRRAIGQA